MINDELKLLFVNESGSNAKSAEETSSMVPSYINKSSRSNLLDEMCPVTFHNMVSSVSCRDLICVDMCLAVGAEVYGPLCEFLTFAY